MASSIGPGKQVDALVCQEILRTLQQHHGAILGIASTDDLGAGLGLSSLDLAEIVARLAAHLRVGPTTIPITDLKTVADLCRAVRDARSAPDQPAAESDELTAARLRAEARRLRG